MPNPKWWLTGTPRPVQVKALLESKGKRGWAHFMEMRLGKTAVALNEFMEFRAEFGFDNMRMVVVTPNSFKAGWKVEAEKWGIDVPVYVFESRHRQIFNDVSGDFILVVNYEALISPKTQGLLDHVVKAHTFLCVDESVRVKNPQSMTFSVLLKLTKKAGMVRLLTGLPAPQSPFDYWAQLRLIGELEGFNQFAFKHTFTRMGGFRGKQILGPRNEERLDEILQGCSFRASRRGWSGDFMEVDHELVEVEMLPPQEKAYKEMRDEFLTWVTDEQAVTVEAVISKYIKMQQVTSGFMLDEEGEVHDLVRFDKLPKAIDLRERLEYQIEHKLLVVAHHRHTVTQLYHYLTDFEPALIAGTDTMRVLGLEVESQKSIFNEIEHCRVMIAQTRAVKYGHRLMGSEDRPCLDMAFFENTYSLDDRKQAEARPQGQGQVAPLHVFDYCSSPLEKAILRNLGTKKEVSDRILEYIRAGDGHD